MLFLVDMDVTACLGSILTEELFARGFDDDTVAPPPEGHKRRKRKMQSC